MKVISFANRLKNRHSSCRPAEERNSFRLQWRNTLQTPVLLQWNPGTSEPTNVLNLVISICTPTSLSNVAATPLVFASFACLEIVVHQYTSTVRVSDMGQK